MPARRRNKVIWGVMLALIGTLGLYTRDNFDAFFAGVGTLDVREEPARNAVVLRWRGSIDAPMASRIAEAFASHKATARTFVLSISSNGGSLDHGAQVVRLLRKIGRNAPARDRRRIRPSLRIHVRAGLSPGTAADRGGHGPFMFHEVSFVDAVSSDRLKVPETARASATDRLFERYFEAAGVSRGWIEKIRTEMAGGRDVWKTAGELVAENAGIVQELQ